MPMLADIDDPPRSRVPGLVIGTLVALPVVLACALWFIPAFVATILGGSRDLDARLRTTDAYMQDLCGVAMNLERDEDLCECVLAVDFPSLDCRPHFNAWVVTQESARCAQEDFKTSAVSYCTCVEAVADKMEAAGPKEELMRSASNAYENCEALPDYVPLPEPAEVALP